MTDSAKTDTGRALEGQPKPGSATGVVLKRLVRRIYCRYCGAKLRTDHVGLYCPTGNCQWRYGLPSDEPGALRPEKPTPAEVRKVKCRTKNKTFREALAIAHRQPNT